MNIVKLSALKPGETGIISALNTDEGLFHRLAALGFRIGKQVNVIRGARFAGPLQVRIGTTDVMLRRTEAHKIDIQPLSHR
jgi:ferrous iron transport protein A